MEKHQYTFGEDLVGKSFNPAQDETVAELKGLYAEIIDLIDDHRAHHNDNADITRHCSIAIKEAQGAQMWAVKAVTRGL